MEIMESCTMIFMVCIVADSAKRNVKLIPFIQNLLQTILGLYSKMLVGSWVGSAQALAPVELTVAAISVFNCSTD